jgi:hypothetical protein
VPFHVAERVLNHTPERIPATDDVHDYVPEKRDALQRWSDRLRRIAAADPAVEQRLSA